MTTSAMLVGFQRCLPWKRIRNLLPIAIAAQRTASFQSFARKRKQSPKPEIKALFHSNVGIRSTRVKTHCVAIAVPIVAMTWTTGVPKLSRKSPYVRRLPRQQICHQRGSKRRTGAAAFAVHGGRDEPFEEVGDGAAKVVSIAPSSTPVKRGLFRAKTKPAPARLAGGRGTKN